MESELNHADQRLNMPTERERKNCQSALHSFKCVGSKPWGITLPRNFRHLIINTPHTNLHHCKSTILHLFYISDIQMSPSIASNALTYPVRWGSSRYGGRGRPCIMLEERRERRKDRLWEDISTSTRILRKLRDYAESTSVAEKDWGA